MTLIPKSANSNAAHCVNILTKDWQIKTNWIQFVTLLTENENACGIGVNPAVLEILIMHPFVFFSAGRQSLVTLNIILELTFMTKLNQKLE